MHSKLLPNELTDDELQDCMNEWMMNSGNHQSSTKLRLHFSALRDAAYRAGGYRAELQELADTHLEILERNLENRGRKFHEPTPTNAHPHNECPSRRDTVCNVERDRETRIPRP